VFTAELEAFLGAETGGVAAPATTRTLMTYGDRTDRLTKRLSVTAATQKLEQGRRESAFNPRRTTVYVDNTYDTTFNGEGVFKNYDHTKPRNVVFRWNLLWMPFILLATFPLWLNFVSCKVTKEISFVLDVMLSTLYLYATIANWRYMWKMIRSFNTPYWQELDPELREKVQHIVVMPTYKEPTELLLETISSVSNQTVAKSIVMVVGMEEKTPNQEEKKKAIRDRFGDSFKALVFAVHPSGTNGEIPGACSNRNYAARAAVKYMVMSGLLTIDHATKAVDLDFTTCTVCDADTTFYYRYFENLTW
jgi:hypothetical protein